MRVRQLVDEASAGDERPRILPPHARVCKVIVDDLFLAPFTGREAAGCGVSREQLRRLCREGTLRRVLQGVYASTHLADDLSVRSEAVSLVLPPGAVLCRRTAAWLRGVDLRCPGEPALPVEVLVGTQTEPPHRRGVLAYQSTLPDADAEIVNGLPVTTGIRTAADLARYRPRTEAVVAVDALAHTGHCSLTDIAALVPTLRGQRGVRQLVTVLSLADARSESQMETRTRILIVNAGLPAPEVQYKVLDQWGRLIARLDLAYPHCRLGLEYDGRAAHTEPSAFDRDRERHNELIASGWTLLRFVARDVLWRPQYVVRQVESFLATQPDLRTA